MTFILLAERLVDFFLHWRNIIESDSSQFRISSDLQLDLLCVRCVFNTWQQLLSDDDQVANFHCKLMAEISQSWIIVNNIISWMFQDGRVVSDVQKSLQCVIAVVISDQ